MTSIICKITEVLQVLVLDHDESISIFSASVVGVGTDISLFSGDIEMI